ncbi:MAG: S8 family serine peptidase, partial [Planctomycetia bacterium]|nr:S8 family serine peptidase [Planctomycetia bacterium]
VGFPGGYPECTCVAASDNMNRIANFSSRGKAVLVSAPGVNVRSCYPAGRYATMSGTSMATPYVAGCAALYVSYSLQFGHGCDAVEIALVGSLCPLANFGLGRER